MIDLSKYTEEQKAKIEQLMADNFTRPPFVESEMEKKARESEAEQIKKLRDAVEREKYREFGKQKFDEGFAYCEEKHKMIPASERLPFESGQYIVQTSNLGTVIAWFEAGEFVLEYPTTEVVGWQYLPEEIEGI